MGLTPPPPRSGAGALADLTDVDLAAEAGAASGARLVHDGERWVGRLPSVFDGSYGGAPAGAVWTARTDSPRGDYGNAATSLGTSLYTIVVDGSFYLLEWDYLTDTWVRNELLPFTPGYVDNSWYCAGLAATPDGYLWAQSNTNLWRYAIADGTWTELGAHGLIHSGRGRLLHIDGSLYHVTENAHNGSAHSYDGQLSRYDIAAETWEALARDPRGELTLGATVTDGARIYRLGGRDDVTGPTDAMARYDPATDSWTDLAPLPTRIHLHGAAFVNGVLYVAGGYRATGSEEMNDLLAYAPGLNAWEGVTDGGLVGRYGPSLTAIGTSRMVAHGDSGTITEKRVTTLYG